MARVRANVILCVPMCINSNKTQLQHNLSLTSGTELLKVLEANKCNICCMLDFGRELVRALSSGPSTLYHLSLIYTEL